jgi:trans-L-3-hydroxyproline dehydratase
MTRDWTPPPEWTRITTLDVHTAGEPLRIITGGFPPIPGSTILEKRRFARENLDHLRTALMWEPRGHADMYGAILTDAVTEDGDAGVLFLHNEGYSTMCGHGIIGLAMAGVNGGLLPTARGSSQEGEAAHPVTPGGTSTLRLDTPAGRVTAFSHWEGGEVRGASFDNVPSFVLARDEVVPVEGVGEIRCDVAFGGAFYAICHAEELGVSLEPEDFRTLMDLGMRVKRAVARSIPIEHPHEPELGFLYGTIIVAPPHKATNHSRNVCIFANGEVDRSPTGTGVSARAALLHARGELQVGDTFTVESILGTTFTGEVRATTSFGPYQGVIPRVSGTSYITGRNEALLDPEDPLGRGFLLRSAPDLRRKAKRQRWKPMEKARAMEASASSRILSAWLALESDLRDALPVCSVAPPNQPSELLSALRINHAIGPEEEARILDLREVRNRVAHDPEEPSDAKVDWFEAEVKELRQAIRKR